MDKESTYAVHILETIGLCSAQLMELGRELSHQEKVVAVKRDIDCVAYPVTGTTFAIYLDAELRDGNCLSFSLLLEWNEKEWVTNTKISLIDQQGSREIKYFPEKRTEFFSEVLEHLASSTLDLVNSSNLATSL